MALLVAVMDLPAFVLPLSLFLVAAAFLLVLRTQIGLCFAAFAIVPLGIVQIEVAGVTVNLPEVLILALFIKEAFRFIAGHETLHPALPLKSLLLYLLAAFAAACAGLKYGNGVVPVLQDCRQFTEYIIFYLIILHRVTTRQQILQILAAFTAGSLLIAVHGVLQRFTGMGIPGNQLLSDLVYHGGIRSGSFYGSTPLGALMVLGLGPTLGLLLASRRHSTQALLGGVAALLLTTAVFTNTRASWLAIALLVVFVFCSVRKTKLMIALAVVAVLAFSVFLGPLVVERMGKLKISKSERSLRDRVHYYTAAWHIFQEYPRLGLGWGCYYSVEEIVTNQRYVARSHATRGPGGREEHATVHSAYLQLLVKAGLFGVVSFALVLLNWVAGLFHVIRAKHTEELDYHLFIGVSAALIGYLFHSTFENFFQWPVMSQAFWMLLALSTLMGYQIIHKGKLQDAAPEEAA
jgi:O-antigen ligase